MFRLKCSSTSTFYYYSGCSVVEKHALILNSKARHSSHLEFFSFMPNKLGTWSREKLKTSGGNHHVVSHDFDILDIFENTKKNKNGHDFGFSTALKVYVWRWIRRHLQDHSWATSSLIPILGYHHRYSTNSSYQRLSLIVWLQKINSHKFLKRFFFLTDF